MPAKKKKTKEVEGTDKLLGKTNQPNVDILFKKVDRLTKKVENLEIDIREIAIEVLEMSNERSENLSLINRIRNRLGL